MESDNKPDPQAFIDNLKAPISLKKKLFLFFRNNVRKVLTAKSCCGHLGEPGC